MYGHGLNLNEQWVQMLEKVGGMYTVVSAQYSFLSFICWTIFSEARER